MNTHADHGERGFTIVEMAISMVVLAGLAIVLGSVMDTGLGAYQSSSPAVVTQITHRTLDKIADRIAFAGFETLVLVPEEEGLEPDGAEVSFYRCLGSTAGLKDWSEGRRIFWRPEDTDPTDKIDNDGDGSVDEGMVVLVLDEGMPTESTVVLARGVARHLEGELPNGVDDNGNGFVDERGLLLEIQDRAVQISLTLERTGRDGQPVVTTARTLVALKN
ncbi:MAG: hypothetical protein ABFS86_09755 [Planctomycetota bacterium]